MLNLSALKSLKSKIQPVKTVASSGFLNALNNLDEVKSAKQQTIVRDENLEDNFNNIYMEGIEFFKKFLDATNSQTGFDLLHKSANKFSKAIEIKKTKAEPYFYLAYIFFILKEISLSMKYLKVSSFLNPELRGLNQLKKEIDDYINNPQKNISEEKEKTIQNINKIPIQTSTYKKPIFKTI